MWPLRAAKSEHLAETLPSGSWCGLGRSNGRGCAALPDLLSTCDGVDQDCSVALRTTTAEASFKEEMVNSGRVSIVVSFNRGLSSLDERGGALVRSLPMVVSGCGCECLSENISERESGF